jgi:hypothetical protein
VFRHAKEARKLVVLQDHLARFLGDTLQRTADSLVHVTSVKALIVIFDFFAVKARDSFETSQRAIRCQVHIVLDELDRAKVAARAQFGPGRVRRAQEREYNDDSERIHFTSINRIYVTKMSTNGVQIKRHSSALSALDTDWVFTSPNGLCLL